MKNKIVNYFVGLPIKGGNLPRVFKSPVSIGASIAIKLLNNQLKNNKQEQVKGDLLHVCFDADSNIIYLPNSASFSKELLTPLLQAAKIRISKDFGGYASRPPIEGNPFSSLRVRSLKSFPYAYNMIKKHYQDQVFVEIPVVEANMMRMPHTKQALPPIFQQKGFMGGYISPSYAKSVTFFDEIDNKGNKNKNPVAVLKQETPFILINMERGLERTDREPTATEKEGVVLNGYRDYLYDVRESGKEDRVAEDINSFADLYSIKRQLYLGWSLEEVSLMFSGTVKNFPDLITFIDRLMKASNSLVEEGYKSPAAYPYYLTFKTDIASFPIRLDQIMNLDTGTPDPFRQHEYFKVIDYDLKTGYIIVETPVYIPPQLCKSVLNAKSVPFVGKYNEVFNTIDSKGEDRSYKDLVSEKRQLAKIKALISREIPEGKEVDLKYRVGPEAKGQWATDPNIFNVRKISDYLYATDFIKDMCKRFNEPFLDFDVIIGPIERFMGAGSQGGYIDESGFKKSKMDIPYKLQEGLYMSPPCILINSVSIPSYADQTETLIHEYRHYIYMKQNPNYEKGYGNLSDKTGDELLKEWNKYLTDPNEREAHISEIEYAIKLGKSVDEIIRDKVGGKITMENYPIALKFEELVREVVEKLKKKEIENEKPIRTDR